ncbi:MAG: phosphoribosylanthranilate isomerase [Geodermatophilaceae bacterium]|nr:phosphoribosylanthranilate isomerase [Geodermatophilaceae bacterium]
MRVKICGNRTLEDARAAAAAGADMLGFIFYERSVRGLTPEVAAAIVAGVREEFGAGAPLMVGVFVDEYVETVKGVIEQVGLDLVQLHGSEPPAEVRQLAPFAFKALRPQNRGDAEAMSATYARVALDRADAPDFLIDAHHPWKPGGTGKPVELPLAQVLARRFRILLAGGLTAETVAAAIERVDPWGVDVASGVEHAPGVRDHGRVAAFIGAARAAGAEGGRVDEEE